MVMHSVVDPDFKMQILIRDQIQLISADLYPDPIYRAKNYECFTFLKLENPSSGSKL